VIVALATEPPDVSRTLPPSDALTAWQRAAGVYPIKEATQTNAHTHFNTLIRLMYTPQDAES